MARQVQLPPPEGGWKAGTFYLIEVAWNVNNPIHRAIFYSGFLDGDQPGSGSAIFNPSYEPPASWKAQLAHIKVVREIVSKEEFNVHAGIMLVPGHNPPMTWDPEE